MMRKILALFVFILIWVSGSALMDFYFQWNPRAYVMLYGVIVYWISIGIAAMIDSNF
jgi:hypothetical protein